MTTGHRNWVSVGNLGPLLQCEICRDKIPLPVHFAWDFYLNDFLAEGLREHGLLGMIWVLSEMQGSSRNTFFFAPPLALYRAYPEPRTPPDAEIDLCAVIDGQFVLGEVKESGREVNDRLGNTLISLANQIRPDQVVIACLDSSAQTALNVQAQRIGTALNTLACSVKTMVPNPASTVQASGYHSDRK